LLTRPAVIDPIARYLPRNAISAYPTCIRRPRYGGNVWCEEIRMASLPENENILKISLLALTEYTSVTDGQTDGHRTTAGRAYKHRAAEIGYAQLTYEQAMAY